MKKYTAYDYDAQRWCEGQEALKLLIQQTKDDIELLLRDIPEFQGIQVKGHILSRSASIFYLRNSLSKLEDSWSRLLEKD